MDSSAFDYDEQAMTDKTSFDLGFYPDGRMVQLDGSFSGTTHSKGVSSDGECDHEETETGTDGWWLQCHTAEEDVNGTGGTVILFPFRSGKQFPDQVPIEIYPREKMYSLWKRV